MSSSPEGDTGSIIQSFMLYTDPSKDNQKKVNRRNEGMSRRIFS